MTMKNSEESPRTNTQTTHDVKVLRKQGRSDEILKDQEIMSSDSQRNTESRDVINPMNGEVEPGTVTIRLCTSEATDCSADAQDSIADQNVKQEAMPPPTPVCSNRKALTLMEVVDTDLIKYDTNTATDISKPAVPKMPPIDHEELAKIDDTETIPSSTNKLSRELGAAVRLDEGRAIQGTAIKQPNEMNSEVAKLQSSEVDQGLEPDKLKRTSHEEETATNGNGFSKGGAHVDIIMMADIPESLKCDVVEAWGEDGPLELDRPAEEENAIETSYTWEPSFVVNEGVVFESYAAEFPRLPRIDSEDMDEVDDTKMLPTNNTKADLELEQEVPIVDEVATEGETAKQEVDSNIEVATLQSSFEDLDRELESIIPSVDDANQQNEKKVHENSSYATETEMDAGFQLIGEENMADDSSHQEEKKEEEYTYTAREMDTELPPIDEEIHEEANIQQRSSATGDDDDDDTGLESERIALTVSNHGKVGEEENNPTEMVPSPEATHMSDSNAELKDILRKEQIEMAYEKCDFLMRKFVLEVKIGELRDDIAFLSKKKYELNRIMLGIQIRQLREV